MLIWKGINFVRDTTQLESMIRQTGVGVFTENENILVLLITILTLLCGLFITIGLYTRLAAIVQIPVVLVALFFVNIKNMERNGFELVLSAVALVLLILFAVKGSGAFSADEYFRRGAALDKTGN